VVMVGNPEVRPGVSVRANGKSEGRDRLHARSTANPHTKGGSGPRLGRGFDPHRPYQNPNVLTGFLASKKGNVLIATIWLRKY